jgi:hypothetical protein
LAFFVGTSARRTKESGMASEWYKTGCEAWRVTNDSQVSSLETRHLPRPAETPAVAFLR